MALVPQSYVSQKTMDNLVARFYTWRAKIEEQTISHNSDGSKSLTWSTRAGLGEVPCRMVPLSVRQRQLATMEFTGIEYNINIMGYYDEITTTDRITIDGIVWDVISVKPSSGNVQTLIEVKRVQN
jgi:hypothetical protein